MNDNKYGKGIVAFWRIPNKHISRASLEASILNVAPGGIDKLSFPQAASPSWLLKHKSGALERILGGRLRVIVRKVRKEKHLGMDREHYACLVMRATTKETYHFTDITVDESGACDHTLTEALVPEWLEHSCELELVDAIDNMCLDVNELSVEGVYFHSQVNRMLVSFMNKHKGVLIRPTGGVWFIPNMETSENGEFPTNGVTSYVQLRNAMNKLGVTLYVVNPKDDEQSKEALVDGAKAAFAKRCVELGDKITELEGATHNTIIKRTGDIVSIINDARLYADLLSFKSDSIVEQAAGLAAQLKEALS